MNEIFRTPVQVTKINTPIDHSRKIMMIGSCFSENIYQKLKTFHFKVISNPTGILYNPLSITSVLKRLLQNKIYTDDELLFSNGIWKSLDHHSMFNDTDLHQCLKKINSEFSYAANFINQIDMLILTFGSAFVYQSAETKQIVANCHKIPESKFIRQLASIDEIISSFKDILNQLLKINPALKIILTVSPVRHLRDNAHENMVSKSHLIAAIYKLEKELNQIYYFPAFELMMDELRDYRFYDSDMIHPSETAIEFLWKRFYEACIEKRSIEFIARYAKIVAARAHRIMFPGTITAREFTEANIRYLDTLKREFFQIDFSNDYKWFQNGNL